MGGAWFFLRVAAAWMVGVRVLNDPSVRRYWFLAPLRELITVGLWVASLFYKKITSRDQQFVTEQGRIVRI